MNISAMSCNTQFCNKVYTNTIFSFQRESVLSEKTDGVDEKIAESTSIQKRTNLNTIFEKLKTQSMNVQSGIYAQNSSFISQAKGSFEQVENERYIVKKSEDISGYWEVFDKELNTHFTFNPNASNVQRNDSTGKTYLIAEEPGYGYCFAEEMPDKLMDSLKEFMNIDELKVNPLDRKYIIKTDPTTGIDSFTLSGQEGCISRIMISSKEQMEKLQELANVYANNYPNLVTSNDMALYYATSEVLGTSTRTTNGIMITCQTGMMYMDEINSDRDWGVTFDQSEDTYKKVSQAIKLGMIGDIENYDLWKEWFDDNEIAHEKNITDEELAELLMQDRNKIA